MHDEELRLPYHDSISVCTAPSHSKTTVERPHDGPDVGVDSAVNLRPDRDVVVRFVPREP